MHAGNPQEIRQESAQNLINLLLSATTILCVDPGFDIDSARNRSQIGAEYLVHLRFGTVGYVFVQSLASSARVVPVSRRVSDRVAKKINQSVFDKTDRVFAKIATNTQELVFVSHDFEHYPGHVRHYLEQEIDIKVIDCATCLPHLRR